MVAQCMLSPGRPWSYHRQAVEQPEAAVRLGLQQEAALQAMEQPEVAVRLGVQQEAALLARRAGAHHTHNVHYRPKPHFRTSAPGIRTVLGANILLVWLVCTIKI
ncbi:hypothetical protein CVIRNUC_008478 [Coccomyxa viridis]|uniref:Uncharacterized protein n=1 Tax=Coccomyxa viridis TaxID=1274662 RepID=A0AAV1IF28_9CHLO|nr:hypothetical protein CVIRNUC_008478 [Coccomyxa viridis]